MYGKVAFVTGGAGGLGTAICKAFVKEDATVVVADSDFAMARIVSDEISSGNGVSLPVEIDVKSTDSITYAVDAGVKKFGRIDFLIHCAGNNIAAPSLEMSMEQWKDVLDTHLTGGFLCCQAVGRQIVKQGDGGRIVLMSSVAATAPVPERGAYGPAKAGLVNLAGMLALEWAQYKINVNAICPGVVMTPMTKMVYQRDPSLRGPRIKKTPMGREGEPEEIADLAVFLCSDKSTYINGVSIPIDGAFLLSPFFHAG